MIVHVYDRSEEVLRSYHAALIDGISMQDAWLREFGFAEPGIEMDVQNENPRNSDKCEDKAPGATNQ